MALILSVTVPKVWPGLDDRARSVAGSHALVLQKRFFVLDLACITSSCTSFDSIPVSGFGFCNSRQVRGARTGIQFFQQAVIALTAP